MVNLRFIVERRIGIRTLWKSFNVYSKGKAYKDRRSLADFLISGNTCVRLEKNVRIINKGSFTLGLQPEEFHVSTNPCVLGMGENSKLAINGSCRVGLGVTIVLLKDAFLELGTDVYINSNSTLVCGKHIKIGDGSRISWNAEICDTDFHRIVREGSVTSEPIEIGRNTLIGRRAMILKGVKVGDGSVVAAGAVVTKDVPENCLVAGVPARIVRREIKWE
jgi:acetyltransferase-like isoleucine patch superfamily enzyme